MFDEVENIGEYYKRRPHNNPKNISLKNTGNGHFNVFKLKGHHPNGPFKRRDFYNVVLILSPGKIRFSNHETIIDRPALVCSNPMIPYSWEAENRMQEGWFCVFTESFIYNNEFKETLISSPLFQSEKERILFPDPELIKELENIFEKMVIEIESSYEFKFELLRNYLYLIIHHVIKSLQPDHSIRASHSVVRTVSDFLELLERQFPIENPVMPLRLTTATDYADHLAVHVNHLNRSVKKVTGKTTTDHISMRIILEAQALLQHSKWNIAQIAYSLGFKEPAYFANFFKKHTGEAPKISRQEKPNRIFSSTPK